MENNYVIYEVLGKKIGRDPRTHYIFLNNIFGFKFLAIKYGNSSYIISPEKFGKSFILAFSKPHGRPLLLHEIESGKLEINRKNYGSHNYDIDEFDYCYHGNDAFFKLRSYSEYLSERIKENYENRNM